MTTTKKDASFASRLLRNASASSSKMAAFDHGHGSKTERVTKAFETASKRTGTFESKYAKK